MSREQLYELMRRYVQLGQLIPPDEDDQLDQRDNVKLVLAEMEEVKAEIDKLLTASQARKP